MKSVDQEVVFDRTLQRLRPVHPAPVLSSSGLNWNGCRLEQYSRPSVESHEIIWLNHAVFVHLNNPTRFEVKPNGHWQQKQIFPGQISIVPAGEMTSVRSSEPAECVMVSIDPAVLAGSGVEDAQLSLVYGIEDRFIEGVCMALRTEVAENGKAGPLYVDSMVHSLAVHLARQYGRQTDDSAASAQPHRPAIRRAIEFIQTNLHKQITLTELAETAKLSPFHFARLFKQSVGFSPHQFVLRQRIQRAKKLLIQGDLPASTVATEVGFYDQSHFGFHFKRLTGLSPKRFAESFRRGTKS
jgi:AraC family transcriptional regulator